MMVKKSKVEKQEEKLVKLKEKEEAKQAKKLNKKKMTKKHWLFAIVLGLGLAGVLIMFEENTIDNNTASTQQVNNNPYTNTQPLLELVQGAELKQIIQETGNLWWLSKERENRIDQRADGARYFGNEFSDKKYDLMGRFENIENNENINIKQILNDMNAIVWQWSFNNGADTAETKDMSLKMDAYFPSYMHNINK